MMMYGDDNDLRAGRAIDDGIGEPTHQAASMFAMHLPEALGILTNCIHGRLYRPERTQRPTLRCVLHTSAEPRAARFALLAEKQRAASPAAPEQFVLYAIPR